MKTMKQTWKQSLAAFALLAIVLATPFAAAQSLPTVQARFFPDIIDLRSPGFVTVTLTRVVCPENHVRPTVSLIQSALQSADRKLMSRNGLL